MFKELKMVKRLLGQHSCYHGYSIC